MNSFVKNSSFILIGVVFKILGAIIVDKLLASHLNINLFSDYKLGVTYVTTISVFLSLGFQSSIVRTIVINSKEHVNKIISISFILSAALAILAIVAQIIFEPINLDIWFTLSLLLYSINSIFNGIFSALNKAKAKVLINDVVGSILYIIFILLFLKHQNLYISTAYFIYNVIVLFLNIYLIRDRVVHFNYGDVKQEYFIKYLKYSFPIFVSTMLVVLSVNIDKVILSEYVTKKELALYFSAFAISNMMAIILNILLFAYLPITSKWIDNDKKKRSSLFSSFTSKWTTIIVSIPFGVIIYFGTNIIELLYTPEYINAIQILYILAFAQFINVSLGFTGQNLIALGDSKSQMHIRFISLTIGIAFMIYFLNKFGVIGVAYSILISTIVSNIAQIITLRIKHDFNGYRKQNLHSVIFVLIAGILIYWINSFLHSSIHYLLILLFDLVLFMASLIVFRLLGKEDLRMINILRYEED